MEKMKPVGCDGSATFQLKWPSTNIYKRGVPEQKTAKQNETREEDGQR